METPDMHDMLLALVTYAGPFVPMLAPLFLRRASHQRFRGNLWAFVILTGIQILSFVPFVLAERSDTPDAVYLLFIPFGLGVLLFVSTAVYAIAECAALWSLLRSPPNT